MLTSQELIDEIRRRITETGQAKKLALELGFSPQYLSDVIQGRREIGEALAKKLGYQKRVLWEPIGTKGDVS